MIKVSSFPPRGCIQMKGYCVCCTFAITSNGGYDDSDGRDKML